MWKVVKNPWLECKNNCLCLHNFLTFYYQYSKIAFSLFLQERLYAQWNFFGQKVKGASLPDTRFSASGFFTNQFPQCPLNTSQEPFQIFTKIHQKYSNVKVTDVSDPGDKGGKFLDRRFFHILIRSDWLGVFT
jgi:hypothetical protein